MAGLRTLVLTPPTRSREVPTHLCTAAPARTAPAPSPASPRVPQIINNMSEGLNKKPKEILATIGIETDEAEGVRLADFVA